MKNATSERCAHMEKSDQSNPPFVDNLELDQDLKGLSLTSEEKEGLIAPTFIETPDTASHASGELTEVDIEVFMKKTKQLRKRSQSHFPMTSQEKEGLVAPAFTVDPENVGHASVELTEADIEVFMKKTKEPRKRTRSHIPITLHKTNGPLTPVKLCF